MNTMQMRQQAQRIRWQDDPDCWLLPYEAIRDMFIDLRCNIHGDSREDARKWFDKEIKSPERKFLYYGLPLHVFKTEAEYQSILKDLTENQGLKVGAVSDKISLSVSAKAIRGAGDLPTLV